MTIIDTNTMMSNLVLPFLGMLLFFGSTNVFAIKCYTGAVDNAKLIECPSKPIDRYGLLDRCLTMTTGISTYTCTSKNQTEARELKDNQCTTNKGIKWCVCDKDGCNASSTLQTTPILIVTLL